ncbi:MAG: sulfatase [Verrucomicrobiota bacterium]
MKIRTPAFFRISVVLQTSRSMGFRLGLLLFGLISFHVEAKSSPPNIVLIMADDLGWNGLSCYGSELIDTPYLDKLAAEGMRFTDAYALSQCLPTRAAIFSGQYGARTGLTSVETASPNYAPLVSPGRPDRLDPAIFTIFEMLRDAGYATGMSGKWHLGDANGCGTLLKKHGIEFFHDYGLQWVGPGLPNRNDKQVGAITDEMLGFIESSKEGPFIAYLAHRTPHTPFDVPEEAIQIALNRGFKRSSDPDGVFDERVAAEYVAMVQHLDASVGRLLDKLDELGLTENTLVLFLSDNGGLTRVWRNDPLRGGKGQLYEGGIRVPFIVRWPAEIEAGTTCSTPVHVVDLFPTFMELAGASVPNDKILDGISLLPLLKQSGGIARNSIYSHHPEYVVAFAKTPCSMVRKGNLKLIHYFGDYLDPNGCVSKPHTLSGRFILGPRTEIYDLANDPGETRDLASTMPEKTRELMSDLQAWWQATGARMPKPNPAVDRSRWIWNLTREQTDGEQRLNRPESE